MPAARTAIRTAPSRIAGEGMSLSNSFSGPPHSLHSTARMLPPLYAKNYFTQAYTCATNLRPRVNRSKQVQPGEDTKRRILRMRRYLAHLLALALLGTVTLHAQVDPGDKKDLRKDKQDLRHDRKDCKAGDKADCKDARQVRKDHANDRKDINKDRKALNHDRKDA